MCVCVVLLGGVGYLRRLIGFFEGFFCFGRVFNK